MISSSIRILAFAVLGLAGFAACSSETESSAEGPGSKASSSDSGASSSGSTTTGSSGSTEGDVCEPRSDCTATICECEDKSAQVGALSICARADGECDYRGACDKACGGVATSAKHNDECKTADDCDYRYKTLCECDDPPSIKIPALCLLNGCTTSPQHRCPEVCADSNSSWHCQENADCDVVFCECTDGAVAVEGGSCDSNTGDCESKPARCASSCLNHGGYVGGAPTTVPDAGPGGPKLPGESCTSSTECTAYDCTCNDGTTFNRYSTCLSKKCVDKAATCTHGCQGSGGWDGQ